MARAARRRARLPLRRDIRARSPELVAVAPNVDQEARAPGHARRRRQGRPRPPARRPGPRAPHRHRELPLGVRRDHPEPRVVLRHRGPPRGLGRDRRVGPTSRVGPCWPATSRSSCRPRCARSRTATASDRSPASRTRSSSRRPRRSRCSAARGATSAAATGRATGSAAAASSSER